MRTIHFNTGRLYVAAGQPIAARVENTRRDGLDHVTFSDHGRGIDGTVTIAATGSMTDEQLARAVMREYDHNRYTHAAPGAVAWSGLGVIQVRPHPWSGW